jgi:hypothetical protein
MSARERARCVALVLNQSQTENLDRWGYPNLFSDFRFHMTLTSKVRPDRRDIVLAALQKALSRTCGDRPILIDRITLMRQDDTKATFRVIDQTALQAAR